MNKIINLKDLLKHEILDLCSAEEQILNLLPQIIEDASGPGLKSALTQYQSQCKAHLDGLENLKTSLSEEKGEGTEKGFFSKLFGGSNKVTSKGIEGLLKQWDLLIKEDLTAEATDASIIGFIQKVGHYKIAGYGTMKAYSMELKIENAMEQMGKALQEEYLTDRTLTQLALESVNRSAENAVDNDEGKKQAFKDELDYLENSISLINSSEDEEDQEEP